MLTIQPNLLNSHKQQSFARRLSDVGYTPYEDVTDTDNGGYNPALVESDARKDMEAWKQSQRDLETLQEKTASVPVLNKGINFLSGLIPVAIGWGGLRWGAAGTLKVLERLGQTKLVQSVKGFAKKGTGFVGKLFQKGKTFFKGSKLYEKAGTKFAQMKGSALETKAGKKLSTLWNNLKGKNIVAKLADWKTKFVDWAKKLNPKQIFVETMGVAGGATAAVQQLGGKPVDGVNQVVSDDGYVEGVPMYEEYNNVA